MGVRRLREVLGASAELVPGRELGRFVWAGERSGVVGLAAGRWVSFGGGGRGG